MISARRTAEALAAARYSGTGECGKMLKRLAAEERCARLDMTTSCAESIRSSRLHPLPFHRDRVPANKSGEPVLGRILAAFFGPEP